MGCSVVIIYKCIFARGSNNIRIIYDDNTVGMGTIPSIDTVDTCGLRGNRYCACVLYVLRACAKTRAVKSQSVVQVLSNVFMPCFEY